MIRLEDAFVQQVMLPLPDGSTRAAGVLRIDKIHATVSGNKWFKLKYNLQQAIDQQKNNIITFGGAHSNHIVAAAYACARLNLQCNIFIRGDESVTPSEALLECRSLNAKLHFASRNLYGDKTALYEFARQQFPGAYMIEEGGCNALGVKGSEEILSLTGEGNHSHIFCAVGTGTMMAGLINASNKPVIGISALKMQPGNEVEQFIEQNTNKPFSINYDYHFGGYAKKTTALIEFMNKFYQHTGIATDFVYTAKLMFGIIDLFHRDTFPTGSKPLIIHSGGLQGNRSLPKNTLVYH